MKPLLQRIVRYADAIQHPYIVLTSLFFLSRLVLWQIRPMDINLSNMHFLDVSFLKNHLLHGLYYMHAQPPLFNAFIGLVLKAVPPPHIRLAFTGLFSLMALFLTLGGYRLMEDLRISKGVRFLFAIGILFFPSTIQGETWLYFSLPMAFLLMLSLIALYRGLTRSPLYGALFLVLLSVIVLTRSAYHLVVWMLPLALLVIVLSLQKYGKKAAAKLAVCAIVVSLLPLALYCRNYKQYGVFQSSTWLGFSLWSQVYYVMMDPPRIEKLIAEKKVTPLARYGRFEAAENYMAYYQENRKTGIDLFDQLHTTHGGINYNHYIFPQTDKEFYRNSVAILKEYPKDYVKAVLNGTYLFFGFSPYRFFNNTQLWLYPKTPYSFVMVFVVPPLFLAMFLITLVMFCRGIWVEWKRPGRDYGRVGTLTFMLFTMAYMTAQTILLVFPEANYIRIPMDPFILIGVALAVDGWVDPRPTTAGDDAFKG